MRGWPRGGRVQRNRIVPWPHGLRARLSEGAAGRKQDAKNQFPPCGCGMKGPFRDERGLFCVPVMFPAGRTGMPVPRFSQRRFFGKGRSGGCHTPGMVMRGNRSAPVPGDEGAGGEACPGMKVCSAGLTAGLPAFAAGKRPTWPKPWVSVFAGQGESDGPDPPRSFCRQGATRFSRPPASPGPAGHPRAKAG